MTTIQPLSPEDAPAAAAMRQAASAHKGDKLGPEARPMFDAMFAATPAAAKVRVEPATVGGASSSECQTHNRARAAGVDITLSVWAGMPHVFQSSLGKFLAAERSVNAIGEFLRQRLIGTSPSISNPIGA